jgi:hypothetical protein
LHKIIERLEVVLVASPKTLCVNPKTITTSYMASLQGEQQPNHAKNKANKLQCATQIYT